jgi:hypothetical protein
MGRMTISQTHPNLPASTGIAAPPGKAFPA